MKSDFQMLAPMLSAGRADSRAESSLANCDEEFGGSGLGHEPLPPLIEITANPQFALETITKADCEIGHE